MEVADHQMQRSMHRPRWQWPTDPRCTDRRLHQTPFSATSTSSEQCRHFGWPWALPLAYVARISTPTNSQNFITESCSQRKRQHTLARSIGWITTEAKVAALPPQTKGSAVFAIPMVIAFFCGQKMAERDDRSAKCRSGRGTDRFFANLLFLSLFSSFFFYVVKNPKWPSTFLP